MKIKNFDQIKILSIFLILLVVNVYCQHSDTSKSSYYTIAYGSMDTSNIKTHSRDKAGRSIVKSINENEGYTVWSSNGKCIAFYGNAQELIKVSDSTFARRNSSQLIQFRPNTENETIDLLYINRKDETTASTLVKMNTIKKEPMEFLIDDQFKKALKSYRTFIEQHPKHPTVTEDYLNDSRHHFLKVERIKITQNTLKLNTVLYPNSFQVYDSYAEACAKAGEIDLAIINYSKSIELNPQNNRA